MNHVLYEAKKDALFPEGFGFILRPSEKIETSKTLIGLMDKYSDQLKDHGVILVERENVKSFTGLDIFVDEENFYHANHGLGAQLMHTHGKINSLFSPEGSRTKTIFSTRAVQRAQLESFMKTSGGVLAKTLYPSLSRSMIPNETTNDELMDSSLGEAFREEYLATRTGKMATEISIGIQKAQRDVSEDLMEVDWKRFFGCRFVGGLPHARDLRQYLERKDEHLYVLGKPPNLD